MSDGIINQPRIYIVNDSEGRCIGVFNNLAIAKSKLYDHAMSFLDGKIELVPIELVPVEGRNDTDYSNTVLDVIWAIEDAFGKYDGLNIEMVVQMNEVV